MASISKDHLPPPSTVLPPPLTAVPPQVCGLTDRGTIAVGMRVRGHPHHSMDCRLPSPTARTTSGRAQNNAIPRAPKRQNAKRQNAQNAKTPKRPPDHLSLCAVPRSFQADMNVIDLAALSIEHPYISYDVLPTGAKFWTQDVKGYDCTIIRGQVTYRHNKPTGALPGTNTPTTTHLPPPPPPAPPQHTLHPAAPALWPWPPPPCVPGPG